MINPANAYTVPSVSITTARTGAASKANKASPLGMRAMQCAAHPCVLNKIDHVGDAAAQAEREAALRVQHPDCSVMSARRSDDVAKLREAIVAFFQRGQIEAEIFLPWSAQQLRGEIFARCEVLEERADDEGAFLRIRGEREAVNSLCERFGPAR